MNRVAHSVLTLLALAGLGLALGPAGGQSVLAAPAPADGAPDTTPPRAEAAIAEYYQALESLNLLDVETGSRDALRRELGAAEDMLKQGAAVQAAVALYAIVESPRFTAFEDFVEYHNAEYDLAAALAMVGAYDSALGYVERALGRGPESMYFVPGHRLAVDIAMETRDYQGVLQRVERAAASAELPGDAADERRYLAAHIAYAAGDLDAAEATLSEIGMRSRLRTSAVYLRGVIRVRQGRFQDAAAALCEIATLPDDNPMAFVVDGRYYTVKDLARLGLGRIAHERVEYDDAYYHYFQIPDDSDQLPRALFEAAWSMYQKRELGAARDLLDELFASFPGAPQIPEARLLAGYVALADCRFDEAQTYYDNLVLELQPLVEEIDRIRENPERRRQLFDRALERWQAERADPTRSLAAQAQPAGPTSDSADGADLATIAPERILALLQVDAKFVRLHEAVRGLRQAAVDAPHGVRAWSGLGRRVAETRVRAGTGEASIEQEDAADANAVLEDVRRLREELARARAELGQGVRAGTLPEDAAKEERERLRALGREIAALEDRAAAAARAADAAIEDAAAPSLRGMIRADLGRARQLDQAARSLTGRLDAAADELARQSVERLYRDMRRILDKAKLGKIDAVIGQKRSLDIQVQDLAAGRYPVELRGRLWEEGLIGDDEEFWPYEGEYWADEYEGWR
jgi:tetratricopeptide (TPR) repeat protein